MAGVAHSASVGTMSRTRRAMAADLHEVIVDRPQWHLQSKRRAPQLPSVRHSTGALRAARASVPCALSRAR